MQVYEYVVVKKEEEKKKAELVGGVRLTMAKNPEDAKLRAVKELKDGFDPDTMTVYVRAFN